MFLLGVQETESFRSNLLEKAEQGNHRISRDFFGIFAADDLNYFYPRILFLLIFILAKNRIICLAIRCLENNFFWELKLILKQSIVKNVQVNHINRYYYL